MDPGIITDKLASLMRCAKRVEQVRTSSSEELLADVDRQDILTLNLVRAVQICVDIASHLTSRDNGPYPYTMAESFDRLHAIGAIDEQTRNRLRSAVGFRNIVVHSYQAISWEVVQRVSGVAPDEFRAYSRQVLGYMGTALP